MTEGLLADASARVRAAAPESTPETVEQLVRDYLEAAEPDDGAAFTAADVAGAVLSVLRAREPAVQVANPTTATDGWESRHTVVEIVAEDLPFILDSVSTAIVRRGYDLHLVLHPLLGAESHLHVEIDRETDPAMLDELRTALTSVVADVRAAVGDWAPMRAEVLARADELRHLAPATADDADVAEAITYLAWLADDHFTLVAAVDTGVDGRILPGSELGVARLRPVFREEAVADVDQPFVLTLTKSLERSTVHRDVPLDFVGVRRFGPDGRAVGETRFLGLYTANVYSQSVATIPVLRRKAEQVVSRAGFPPDGHDGRALTNVLETYPRDELFRLPVDELAELAVGIVHMGQRRRVRLFVSRDERGCFVSCLVYLPRDRYTTQVRMQIVDMLQRAFGGSDADYTALVTESVMARLHVVVSTADGGRDADVLALEADLGRLVRDWTDNLRDELVAARGEERGLDAFHAWLRAFPAAYQADVSARVAVADLTILEGLDRAGDLAIRLVPPTDAQGARIKLYRSGSALVLSDVMPLLEHLGVTVVDERPYAIAAPDGQARWIYSFGVRADEEDPLRDPEVQDRVADVFLGVWAGTIENDGLNRLVLGAGLTARDVVIVRALTQYLRQAGVRFTDAYLADTLVANPEAVRVTVALFHQRLDPERARDEFEEARISDELARAVDAVASLDADRILRSLAHLVLAVVRTNAYLPRDYLAVKFDPALLEFLPAPRPRHEIWVASPSVEGVHLRAGDIARGGIRWSDRREDFRTEVLGLMKAQTVKNAVIVPVGAKGGFVVKHLPALRSGTEPALRSGTEPAPRDARQAAVLAGYRTFIRGLLDLSDTLVDGRVVPPVGVVRYDGDDPYLVVAADKGTGSFSDVANELAAEYGYWLGDAFASGGSAGFDHKEMGITTRGAWISVLAHFRSLGVDADTEPLTIVGIGDMSGDVFGNGLL
ncbi:MAG: glutamate dehydrogenase, partial [Actinomycetota bacterium]|nr:glutamate dehydrogenase [Actinomycetota bacterium]